MTDQITVERTGRRPLRFRGELIASAETSAETARGDYSGQTGIWQKAAVYRRTAAPGYVLELRNYTQWQGARDEFQAWACDDLPAVCDIIEKAFPLRIADELLGELDVAEDLDREGTP